MLEKKEEGEGRGEFVEGGRKVFDVAEQLGEESGGRGEEGMAVRATVQVGQTLAVRLPAVGTLERVRNDKVGELGVSPAWHGPTVSPVGGGGEEEGEGGRGAPPLHLVTLGLHSPLSVDAIGHATVTLYAAKTGTCTVLIPFHSPTITSPPTLTNAVTITVTITPPPYTFPLASIILACATCREETENFTTLRGLLSHVCFREVGVRELEGVMSEYERCFKGGVGGREGRSVL